MFYNIYQWEKHEMTYRKITHFISYFYLIFELLFLQQKYINYYFSIIYIFFNSKKYRRITNTFWLIIQNWRVLQSSKQKNQSYA
jgi:hypothetical protein